MGLMTLTGSRYLRSPFENAHSIPKAGWRGSLWTDAPSALLSVRFGTGTQLRNHGQTACSEPVRGGVVAPQGAFFSTRQE